MEQGYPPWQAAALKRAVVEDFPTVLQTAQLEALGFKITSPSIIPVNFFKTLPVIDESETLETIKAEGSSPTLNR